VTYSIHGYQSVIELPIPFFLRDEFVTAGYQLKPDSMGDLDNLEQTSAFESFHRFTGILIFSAMIGGRFFNSRFNNFVEALRITISHWISHKLVGVLI